MCFYVRNLILFSSVGSESIFLVTMFYLINDWRKYTLQTISKTNLWHYLHNLQFPDESNRGFKKLHDLISRILSKITFFQFKLILFVTCCFIIWDYNHLRYKIISERVLIQYLLSEKALIFLRICVTFTTSYTLSVLLFYIQMKIDTITIC